MNLVMRTFLNIAVLLLCFTITMSAQDNLSEDVQNWPQWRGPLATGVAPAGNPPIEWDEQTNIKWKSVIPGIGHATPIIWKDQIILLSAVQTDKYVEPDTTGKGQDQNDWMTPRKTDYIHRFEVISVDRNNGNISWQTTVREELPYSHTHQFGSWASHSPVTDGKHIYAYFGSHGLYCLDMKGEIQWERDLGRMEKVMSFGEGSSPVLYKDNLIVLRDHQGQSVLHVLDKNTGDPIWEVNRDEISSWSTPLVIEYEGKIQIITSATNRIRSYDMNNGEVERLAEQLITATPAPDLVVYLQASTGVLLDRINRFGRKFERDMDRSWLEDLVDSYNQWFLRDRQYPVLVVNTDHVDFSSDGSSFDKLVEAVLSHPGGVQGFNPSSGGGLRI